MTLSLPKSVEELDWSRLRHDFWWIERMHTCPQDAIYHAEGDVGIHTEMVCKEMVTSQFYRVASDEAKLALFCAALIHDVAKPDVTRVENGRVTSPGHSRRGAVMGRGLMWELGVPFFERESACGMIMHHQMPLHSMERADPERMVARISLSVECARLAALAEADIRGRVCGDAQKLLDNIELFRMMADEMECLHEPRQFHNDHSRLKFFHDEGVGMSAQVFDDCRCDVTMLCGLPASGKDTWVTKHGLGQDVISLDDIRDELNVDVIGSMPVVAARARDKMKVLLRAKQPFIFNATNLSRKTRRKWLDLWLDYNARVHIIYLEVPAKELFERNLRRERSVSERVIRGMMENWEPPDLTEAHTVEMRVES